MAAHVLARRLFYRHICHTGGQADRSAEQAAAQHSRPGGDLVARHCPVDVGDDGNVLQRIDEIDKVAERKPVVSPKIGRRQSRRSRLHLDGINVEIRRARPADSLGRVNGHGLPFALFAKQTPRQRFYVIVSIS